MVIHYFRYAGDYSAGWNFWLWPEGGAGSSKAIDTDDLGIVTDSFGSVTTVDISGITATRMGIIVRLGEWVKKDIDKDRFINIPTTAENGVFHVYLVEGDERIGYSLNDPNGPDKSDKVTGAYFNAMRTIKFSLTSAVTADKVSLSINGISSSANVTMSGLLGTMTIPSDVDLTKTYTISVLFPEGTKTYDVTFDGIYDSTEFETAFGYEGDDLGAVVTESTTNFRLWAPISSSVTLKIYNSGSPAYLLAKDSTATDTPSQSIAMTKSEKGTWVASVAQNLHGKYYTYVVTNGIKTNEVVDPYAKSVGVNGIRGMIVDFSQTNPEGFVYGKRPNTMTNYTDAIIYEIHVRDLTSHSSWVVDSQYEKYRGKFMGFTIENTKYQGVSTGIDHIKELGVTHVQILPFFVYGNAIDESGAATQFNWGYMPLNFNALEGHYSTNPFDGAVRINEFKQLMVTMDKNNLRVVMDVVYNHTGQSGDSNFSLILPGYYYRMNSDGSFSNGSGTGNETASERFMMQKFMVDSVVFWANEYNISGFRFDLMALHDTETMNKIVAALHEIDNTILIFGEPWTGGGTPLSPAIAADKVNLVNMPGVAAFNDEIRDGVKGSVFNASAGGFVQGKTDLPTLNKLKYGIVGGTQFPGIDSADLSYSRFWGNNPSQVINYVSAHDNNTLYDKLMMSTTYTQKQFIPDMIKQANAVVLLAQGIPFIHAGEEFMRSKPCATGYSETCDAAKKYDHNSYQSPDSVNQLRWNLKAEEKNLAVFNYYKDLIAFRKAHPALRMTTSAQVIAALDFIEFNDPTVVGYTLSDYANGDSYDTILIIHNTGDFASVKLPEGEDWNLIGNRNGISNTIIKTYLGGGNIPLLENETVILYRGVVILPEESTGCPSCQEINAAIVAMNVLVIGLFFLFRKKF
jgi:pullulanase